MRLRSVLTAVIAAVIIGVALLVGVMIGVAPRAFADDEACAHSNRQCTEVIGLGSYINQVRGHVALPCAPSVVGHFQIRIADFTRDLPDKVVEASSACKGELHKSDLVSVERGFSFGTLACSQFFVREGKVYRPAWGEPVCVTLRP